MRLNATVVVVVAVVVELVIFKDSMLLISRALEHGFEISL
jgi:hypothetical protein